MANGEEISLAGGGFPFKFPGGEFYSANISSDPESGIGKYTDQEIARTLRYGVKRNGKVLIPAMEFQNISDEDLLEREPGIFDVVLVGDLFYEKGLAERVHAWLIAAKANGAAILIGDPGRSYLPKSALQHVIDYDVPVTRELEDAEIKRTAVWRI